MREDDSNWFSNWEEELPSPEELMPLSQTLITPDLALAFEIRNANHHHHHHLPPPPLPSSTAVQPPSMPNSSEFAADSGDNGDEPARTLKRPRLVWTPQLHKRFVDAVAHLGIKNAVPKTIMQLMSVDGLTRENVASHLQKYRLYLKRMQGLSGGGNGGSTATSDDHLFASSPVPPHFLHRQFEHLQHQQQMANSHLQSRFHRQLGHFGSSTNGPFEQPVHLESGNGNSGRKALTLFPSGDDLIDSKLG